MEWAKEKSSVYHRKFFLPLACCDIVILQFSRDTDFYVSANGLPISFHCLNTMDFNEAKAKAIEMVKFLLESRLALMKETMRQIE